MKPDNCIFQGQFGDILLPDLLTFLDMLKRTGRLELRRPEELKRVFWERGEIIYADSNVPSEQVGEYLCRNGWITPTALAEAKRGAIRDDELVKALIAASELRPDVLPRAVKSLVLDIVYSIFEWREGAFRFVVTDDPHDHKVVLKTSVSNIVMEGSRRLDEWKRMRDAFPTDEVRVTRTGETGGTARLSPIELDVLRHVEGRPTAAEIIRRSGEDQFTVLNALLTLLNVGAIAVSHAAEPTPAAWGLAGEERRIAAEIVAAFSNIFADIHARIRAVKGDEGVQRFEATLLKGSFQKSEALSGAAFAADGTLPVDRILENLGRIPAELRIPRLRGSLDRLLAQQVVQLDTSYGADVKRAVSDLIAREKARIASG